MVWKAGHRGFWVLAGAIVLGLGVSQNAIAAQPPQVARLLTWLQGEHDNYEQIWQQKLDGVEAPMTHLHQSHQRIRAPRIGQDVMLSTYRAADAAEGEATRRYLMSFVTRADGRRVRTRVLRLNADADAQPEEDPQDYHARLTDKDTTPMPECELAWQWHGEMFAAHAASERCELLSLGGLSPGEPSLAAFKLDQHTLWTRVTESYSRGRKVRHFTGWMGVKRDRIDPNAGAEDWVFMPSFAIHNEGQIVPLTEKDGTATGYAIQLERLTYQNTGTPVLKLGLIEQTGGTTITYTWTAPGSARIGMNLRWFQAGLTAN